MLEQTAYRNRNGLTDRITYATEEAIRNAYDTEERLISQYLVKADGSETKLFTNTYDNYGNVAVHQDHLTGIRQESTYDLIGRTTGIRSSDGGQIRIGYDEKNRVASLTQKADTSLVKTTYLYGGGYRFL